MHTPLLSRPASFFLAATATATAPLQDDAILLGLAPAPLLAHARRGHDALAHIHWHLFLLEHRRLCPERLQAEVGSLLSRAARGKHLWLR